ncbi:hypothetical protein U1Q18_019100 [Sarracenia purpurea var. burkii]
MGCMVKSGLEIDVLGDLYDFVQLGRAVSERVVSFGFKGVRFVKIGNHSRKGERVDICRKDATRVIKEVLETRRMDHNMKEMVMDGFGVGRQSSNTILKE